MLNVIVLGSGCANCRKLEQLCHVVADENNLDMNLEKVTEFNKFADYGIMFTPGLVINGKVVASGKLPTKETLAHWMIDASN